MSVFRLKNFGEKVDQDNAIRIFAQTRLGRKLTVFRVKVDNRG